MNIIKVHHAMSSRLDQDTHAGQLPSLGKLWRSFTDWGKLFILLIPDTWNACYYIVVELKELNVAASRFFFFLEI